MASQTAAQIGGQWLAHAHREDARFFQRSAEVRGNVAGRKHQGVVHRLQLRVDQNKALRIECQAGALQPRWPSGLCDPHGFIGIKSATIAGVQTAWRHLHHFGVGVHIDIAFFQHFAESRPNPRVVRGQNGFARGHQHKLQVFAAAPQGFEFVAQTILHGQQQLDAAGTTSHHSNGHATPVAGPVAGFVQQGQPALVELRNRFDRDCQRLGAFYLLDLRGRADVDRQQVIGDPLSVAANDFLVFAVKADHGIVDQARAHKGTQTPQIDVHFFKAVMA